MTHFDRPSLMISKLDQEKATALLHEVIRRNYPKADLSHIEAEETAVVNTRKGIATICTEGVGWWADNESGKYYLPFHSNFRMDVVEVTLDELLSCLSDTLTDLAQHIRMFGDRLENNFHLWYGYAKEHPAVTA